MLGYKLFRKRKDGTYGPLFINRKLRLVVGETYQEEDHPTKGYAHRRNDEAFEREITNYLCTRI